MHLASLQAPPLIWHGLPSGRGILTAFFLPQIQHILFLFFILLADAIVATVQCQTPEVVRAHWFLLMTLAAFSNLHDTSM
jgi:hypothetical protein